MLLAYCPFTNVRKLCGVNNSQINFIIPFVVVVVLLLLEIIEFKCILIAQKLAKQNK